MPFYPSIPPQLRCRGICSRQYDDARADRHTAVKVFDVLVGQTNAAGGHEGADGRWLIGAMDAIFRVAEIHRSRADGIGFTAGHEARKVKGELVETPRSQSSLHGDSGRRDDFAGIDYSTNIPHTLP